MNAVVRGAVRALIRDFLRRFLDDNVPAAETQEIAGLVAPFHDSLVPGIRLLNERSFSTRLGNLHERVATVIASAVHPNVRQPYDLAGTIPVLSREFITQRIAQLEARQARPDAMYERQQVLAHFGNQVQAGTRIDLYIRTAEDQHHFFEIKSPKPNLGQCKEMKERLLTAFAIKREESCRWWWGVPYNPYGSSPYTHNYALPFFDFQHEVKLGAEFWEFVGGEGTYDALLEIYLSVGEQFAGEIEALREH